MDVVNQPKVLVIDDEQNMASALVRLLREQHYNALAAYDWEHSIKLIHFFKPDVIILDLSMPGVNGIDLLRMLRRRPELDATQILVMSAAPDMILQETKKLGAQATLAKPAEPGQLMHTLERLVQLAHEAALLAKETAITDDETPQGDAHDPFNIRAPQSSHCG